MLSPSVFVLLVLPFLVPLSVKALQLTISDSIIVSGTPVDVAWSLENGDPFSFGLMQRSLQDDTVKGVTPVNTEEALTGTVSITFNTAGQVLLAGIQELSLEPGQQFHQFAPGKQLTVRPPPFSGTSTIRGGNGITSSTTTETTTSTTSTLTTLTTTISQNSTSTSQNSTTSSTSSFTSQTSSHSFSSSSQPTTSRSVFTISTLPSSTSTSTFSSDTQSTSSSTSQSSIPAASSALSDSESSGATSINKRALGISMAVLGGVIGCLLILYLIVRCQRSGARRRLSAFRSRLDRQPSNARSIMSFYSPNEEDGMSQRSFLRLSSGTTSLQHDEVDGTVAGFTGVGRRGITAPLPHDTEPQVQTPPFGIPPSRDEDSKERFNFASSLERSRTQERDSWADILSEEPLPMYMEPTSKRT